MWRKITYKCTEEENMFFHIYKRNDKEQRQPEQQPVYSGVVTEVVKVRNKDTEKEKVEYLNNFFTSRDCTVEFNESDDGKIIHFMDTDGYEVFFLYN